MTDIISIINTNVHTKLRNLQYPEMLIIITIVSLLDAITTYLILSQGGYEANPLMAGYYQNPALLVLIKISFILIIYAMSAWIEKRITHGGWIIVGIVSVITSLAIINNIIMLLLHG
jgi:hypothetical protein